MKRFDQYKLSNIRIAYDTTDHFNFICPDCNSDCIINKIKTIKKMQIDFKENKDDCTYFEVYCPKCNKAGQRKIYWNSYLHNGRSERGRTDWKKVAVNLAKDESKDTGGKNVI